MHQETPNPNQISPPVEDQPAPWHYIVRKDRSLVMWIAQGYLRLRGVKAMATDKDAAQEALSERGPDPEPASIPRRIERNYDVQVGEVCGNRVATLTPNDGFTGRTVLYLHGGAYVFPFVEPHWGIVDQLSKATGARIVIPTYPLAPDHTWDETYALLDEVHASMLGDVAPSDLLYAGDSAGGGLAAGYALLQKKRQRPLPSRIILFSPWLDVTMSNPDAEKAAEDDAMLAAPGARKVGESWSGNDDPARFEISPLYGDLAGLQPIDIFQGTADMLYPDARTFARKAYESGTDVRLFEYGGAIHDFIAVPFSPEAKDAFTRIAKTYERDD